jgi:hypothetical protein
MFDDVTKYKLLKKYRSFYELRFYNELMITKDLIDKIKVNFSLTNYWLEKFLHVNHAMFFRYANGISEARFSEVMKWLNKLNLCVINEKIYFKTNLHESIDVFPK